MTLRVWPAAVPLDPDARVLPAPLAATLASAGGVAPVILLVAGAQAEASGWAADAAVALAEGWCRDGTRVVLADLGVAAPSLHQRVGEPNEEGLADVFFYGASLRRVMLAAATRCFGFIPAGAAPADSRALLTDAGWRQVVTHFFRDGAVLLAYVPAGADGLDALAARLGAVIALAAPGERAALDRVLPEDAAVLALLEPPGIAGAAAPAAPAEPPEEPAFEPWSSPQEESAPVAEEVRAEPEPSPPEPAPPELAAAAGEPEPPEREPWAEPVPEGDDVVSEKAAAPVPPAGPSAVGSARVRGEDPREALVEALWARRNAGQGPRAPMVDPVPGRRVTEEELLSEPPVLLPEPPGRRRGVSLILWLALGAAVGLGAFFGIQEYLAGDLPFLGGPRVQAPPARPRPATKGLAPRGAPLPPPVQADSLPYSVAIEAYPRYAPAVARAQQLGREERSIGFFVTPMQDRGSIYYHVMAGPVADSVEAAALMQRLLDAGVKTGASQWDIVATRLAFSVGDYAGRADAEKRQAELARKNIPTYLIEVPLPGGPPRWRVYAGAFQGAADAAVLRPVLKSAGIADSLVPRIGITPR